MLFRLGIVLAKYSQIRTIHAFQSIALSIVTSAPYILNDTLNNNLKLETVQLAPIHYFRFHSKLSTHPNPIISQSANISLVIQRVG